MPHTVAQSNIARPAGPLLTWRRDVRLIVAVVVSTVLLGVDAVLLMIGAAVLS